MNEYLRDKKKSNWTIVAVLLFSVIAIYIGISLDLIRLMLSFLRWFV